MTTMAAQYRYTMPEPLIFRRSIGSWDRTAAHSRRTAGCCHGCAHQRKGAHSVLHSHSTGHPGAPRTGTTSSILLQNLQPRTRRPSGDTPRVLRPMVRCRDKCDLLQDANLFEFIRRSLRQMRCQSCRNDVADDGYEVHGRRTYLSAAAGRASSVVFAGSWCQARRCAWC